MEECVVENKFRRKYNFYEKWSPNRGMVYLGKCQFGKKK